MTTSTLPKVKRSVSISPTVRIKLAAIEDWDRKPHILIVWLDNGEGHEIHESNPSYAKIDEWLKEHNMMEAA